MSFNTTKFQNINKYFDKWRSLYLKCKAIDKQKVEKAINNLYAFRGLPQPKIEYYPSPLFASKNFNLDYFDNEIIRLDEPIAKELKQAFGDRLWQDLHFQIYEPLHQQLWREIGSWIYDILQDFYKIWHDLNRPLDEYESYFNPVMDFLTTDYLIARACLFDYAYEELNCSLLQSIWQSYSDLITNCGWLLTYRDICLVCDRPSQLIVDKGMRLHNLGNPAILFNDGIRIYAYKGEILPEKYGKVHPSAWQIKWILEEKDSLIRRILVEGIGYKRICRRTSCKELGKLGHSTLLEIDLHDDKKPVLLLKIRFYDTNEIDLLRVPLDINSVKEAIKWVNRGYEISHDEFHSYYDYKTYS